jgi:hypothetical protein
MHASANGVLAGMAPNSAAASSTLDCRGQQSATPLLFDSSMGNSAGTTGRRLTTRIVDLSVRHQAASWPS